MLDGFIHRLNKKQPLSCPSDIKRFFVTPKQSGQICLLATFLGTSGSIFFPKLDFHNDQIYFKEIALDFLKEKFPAKYPIYFFKTDTSGEKTFEEFYSDDEDYNINTYESLGFLNAPEIQISFEDVETDFNKVFNNPSSNKSDIVTIIKKYIPYFMHIETGKNLDQKM